MIEIWSLTYQVSWTYIERRENFFGEFLDVVWGDRAGVSQEGLHLLSVSQLHAPVCVDVSHHASAGARLHVSFECCFARKRSWKFRYADNHITGSLLNTVLFRRFAYFDASTESLKIWSWQFAKNLIASKTNLQFFKGNFKW